MSGVVSSQAPSALIATSHRNITRDSWIAAAFAALTSSCGFITAGAASAASDDGSTSDAPAAITGFAVEDAKTEPAAIRFVLADAEGDSVEVELSYEVDPDGPGPSSLVSGKLEHLFERRPAPPANPPPTSAALGNPLVLAASPQGTEHVFDWFFTREAGIEDATYTEHVFVSAQVTGGAQSLTPGANAALLGVGNDPPVIVDADKDGFADAVVPTDEVVGLVHVPFFVKDSSLDQVDVQVEYALADGLDVDAGELPDASAFLPATAQGDLPKSIQTTEDGAKVDFFWNPLADLGKTEHDIVLRLTADDRTVGMQDVPLGVGEPVLTRAFRIDNNAAPIVQFDSGALLANQDERRGIPIPYRVIDAESDFVEVIWQWWREGETFPELPADGAALDAILADPELRRANHICTAYPRQAQGRVVPLDATSVRLPELALGAGSFLAQEIEGATLELLRPRELLEPVAATWSANPLESPIAALPLRDGRTALVLDAPGGTGRLRELELATGTIVRELGPLGAGAPTAMAFERGGAAVLVASDLGATWRIERIELASGVATELYASNPSDEPSPVRGLASLGTWTAVLTAGSSLLTLDYRDPLAPRLAPVLDGLATPWGVVVDPAVPQHLYLAERDAPTALGTGRVLSVDLNAHAALPVVARTENLALTSLERPEALALAQRGTRLFAVTRAGGAQRLVGLGLGAKEANQSFPIGPEQRADVASVASGPDGLLLASVPALGELLVAGGVEQRRAVTGYQASTQRVVTQPAFAPEPRSGQSWRLQPPQHVRSAPAGVARTFVWDTRTDLGHGSAFLRAFARDTEAGLAEPGLAPKRVRSALDVTPLELGGPALTDNPFSVAAADLDGDGDQDLVSANAFSGLTVFFQGTPGSFAAAPLVLATPDGPNSVAAADLDGDGDQDLVSAYESGDHLRVFFQSAPGSFAGPSLKVGGPTTTDGPVSVAAADLDGDGDQDFVCANTGSSNLRIFYQSVPGSFVVGHKLGGPAITAVPVSVAAADLNGDGDLDVVCANSGGHDLTIFFRTPVGFGSPLVLGGFPITGYPVSVAAADLDGDGDLDLMSANEAINTLTIFFQSAPGSFDPAPLVLGVPGGSFSGGGQPRSVAAADLDGDGDQDLVSANSGTSTLTVFFQSAPGSFDPAPLALGGSGITDFPVSLAAGDLDGDGNLDLASANLDSDTLTVFFQNAPGSFDPAPLVFGEPTFPVVVDSVAAVDLDGDGDLDLASGTSDSNPNTSGDTLQVFFQSLPGKIDPAPLEVGGGIAHDPFSVAAADLDGDGDQDLASANAYSDNLTVFFQHPPASFDATYLVLPVPGVDPMFGSSPVSVAAADLDIDGDLDLVSANGLSSNLTIFFQSAPGSFEPAPLALGDSGTTDLPFFVAAADLDGDGDQDLVSANVSSNNLTLFFQSAPGSFDPAPLVLGGSGITNFPQSVAAADLDGDGDLDLVSANSFSHTLTVFFQEPGSFDPAPLVLGGSGITSFPNSVAAADLDGDGDLDLVSGGNELSVFIQRAPGSFDPAPLVLSSSGGHKSVAAADIDGDGDPDLVSGDIDQLRVFFGSHR